MITDTGTLTANQCAGKQITNYGQAGDVTLTLPAAAAGYNFLWIAGDAQANYYRIDPGANDSIYLDGVTTGDGKYVGLTTVAIGNAIYFCTVQTGSGTYDWFATTIFGAWAAEAA
jgi:hypothetical protein